MILQGTSALDKLSTKCQLAWLGPFYKIFLNQLDHLLNFRTKDLSNLVLRSDLKKKSFKHEYPIWDKMMNTQSRTK